MTLREKYKEYARYEVRAAVFYEHSSRANDSSTFLLSWLRCLQVLIFLPIVFAANVHCNAILFFDSKVLFFKARPLSVCILCLC